jgi:hypothetical protein
MFFIVALPKQKPRLGRGSDSSPIRVLRMGEAGMGFSLASFENGLQHGLDIVFHIPIGKAQLVPIMLSQPFCTRLIIFHLVGV